MKKRGFTLIELLVAMGLFAFTAVAATTSMLSILNANQQARATVKAMDGLSFVLESMTREIRVGSSFDCAGTISMAQRSETGDCASGTHIGFDSSEGDFLEYRSSGTAIERRVNNGSWIPMTGSDISIDTFSIHTTGSAPIGVDSEQPRVLLLIEGRSVEDEGVNKTFSIQTSVTQRFPDF